VAATVVAVGDVKLDVRTEEIALGEVVHAPIRLRAGGSTRNGGAHCRCARPGSRR